jgi:hypothetical protein
MIEWHIRKQMAKYSWRRVRLLITIIDAGSTDATLRIVQSLAKKYSLQYYCAQNKDESISVLCNLLAAIDVADEHVIGLMYA